MKKTSIVFVFVILLITLLVTRVSAIDMNLINSIRQNEINEAENLSASDGTSNPLANDAINSNTITNLNPDPNTNDPSANVSTTLTRRAK